MELKQRKYTATVKFISGSEIYYPEFTATNKRMAKTRIMLDRQKKGDEMFVKSINIMVVKERQ